MPRTARSPNWVIADGFCTFWCPKCDRWLCRTNAITPGRVIDVVCKRCGSIRLVIPDEMEVSPAAAA